MTKYLKNYHGLSLIEVLASIVLLSIVLIGFMSVFPQMSLMNEKTGENLDGTTIAKELLVEMKKIKYPNLSTSLPTGLSIKESNSTDIIITGQYKNSPVKVTVKKTIDGSSTIQSLHQMKIEVFDANNRLLSTTYGYMTEK